MGYLRPTDAPISDTWQGHRDRNPPSREPGTDYACAYGTDLVMAGDGVISVVDSSNGGGEGRRLSVDLDDGRRFSYIHLSRILGWQGMRVGRGQRGVALSGASGNGSDWYYGAHVHVSLWERPGMSYADSIDFERYVGDPDPIPDPIPIEEDDDMPKNTGYYFTRAADRQTVFGVMNLGSGYLSEWTGTSGDYNDAVREALDFPAYMPITEGHRNSFVNNMGAVRAPQSIAVDVVGAPEATTISLRIALVLGVIGNLIGAAIAIAIAVKPF